MKLKPFSGFSKDLFKFLGDLKNNNNINWFHENRDRYQESVVLPAKSFVNSIAPFFNRLNPAIRTEPKFNHTLLRLNKDMRFVKGDPYRTYFLIHFGRFKMDSEFFVYFSSDEIQIGIFLNKSDHEKIYFKRNFEKYIGEIEKVFDEYKLNRKYDLYELEKEPVKILSGFVASKNLQMLDGLEYLLFQKIKSPKMQDVYSDRFMIEAIKIFTDLYPLYCFSFSRNPLKEIEKFKENFGEMIKSPWKAN